MKEGLMEEKYCIICYEPIGDSELVEIPTPNYEPDKLAHRDCFLTKLEELTSDATTFCASLLRASSQISWYGGK